MLRIRLAALVAWLALLCVTGAVHAEDTVTPTDAVVHRVNVRRFASTGATKVIGSLAPGEHATLLADIPGWYRVQLQDGTVGYVSKRWTRLGSEPTTPVAPVTPVGVPFTLHVVDVGNGDAILLDLGDQEMLIDGGMHARPLLDYVSSVDVIQDPIELAVVTHADSDHWKGMEALIERYPLTVEEFWEPGYDRGCSPTDAYTAFIAEMESAVPTGHYMRPLAEARRPVSIDDTGPQWFTVDHLQGVEFLLLHTDAAPGERFAKDGT